MKNLLKPLVVVSLVVTAVLVSSGITMASAPDGKGECGICDEGSGGDSGQHHNYGWGECSEGAGPGLENQWGKDRGL